MNSWKTTLAGCCAIAAAVFGAISQVLADGNPNWPTVIAAIVAGIGVIFARDDKISDEEAGAGNHQKPSAKSGHDR